MRSSLHQTSSTTPLTASDLPRELAEGSEPEYSYLKAGQKQKSSLDTMGETELEGRIKPKTRLDG